MRVSVVFFFRNTILETVISVLLAVGVGVLGALLLAMGFYQDFWIFVLCFIMACCQYSLLKVRENWVPVASVIEWDTK